LSTEQLAVDWKFLGFNSTAENTRQDGGKIGDIPVAVGFSDTNLADGLLPVGLAIMLGYARTILWRLIIICLKNR
jgi:hypothetical protein